MKILVINQNDTEKEYLSALANDETVDFVKFGCANTDSMNKVIDQAVKKDDDFKIEVNKVNATDPDSVAVAAEGMDLVVDMAAPWMSPYVKQGAMQAEVTYVNLKKGSALWDKFIQGKMHLQNAPSAVIPYKKGCKLKKGLIQNHM